MTVQRIGDEPLLEGLDRLLEVAPAPFPATPLPPSPSPPCLDPPRGAATRGTRRTPAAAPALGSRGAVASARRALGAAGGEGGGIG